MIYNQNCIAQNCFLGCCNKFGYCPSVASKCLYYYSYGWNAGYQSNVCDLTFNYSATSPNTSYNVTCPTMYTNSLSSNYSNPFAYWTSTQVVQQVAGGFIGGVLLLTIIITAVIWYKKQNAYAQYLQKNPNSHVKSSQGYQMQSQGSPIRSFGQQFQGGRGTLQQQTFVNNQFQRVPSQAVSINEPIINTVRQEPSKKISDQRRQQQKKYKWRQQFFRRFSIPFWMMVPPPPKYYKLQKDPQFRWPQKMLKQRQNEKIQQFVQQQKQTQRLMVKQNKQEIEQKYAEQKQIHKELIRQSVNNEQQQLIELPVLGTQIGKVDQIRQQNRGLIVQVKPRVDYIQQQQIRDISQLKDIQQVKQSIINNKQVDDIVNMKITELDKYE